MQAYQASILSGLTPLGFTPSANTTTDASVAGTLSDPASLPVFIQNAALAQEHLARLIVSAQSALAGIENAYQPGTNPAQTMAEIAATKLSLVALLDFLQQSGIGALPLLPPDQATPPSDAQLQVDTAAAIQRDFERSRRMQDGASVVTSLLSQSAGDSSLRK